jgi:hypothetical protein
MDLRSPVPNSNIVMVPRALNRMEDGSGTTSVSVAVKLPDCEVVMLLPDEKSAAVQVPLGQKYSWIFWGVGSAPFGRAVIVSEKPPM